MSLFSRKIQIVEIDYDKLAQSIVKAQEQADKDVIKNAVIAANDELENRKVLELEKANEEWQKSLGFNKSEDIKEPNAFKVLFKILFLRKEKAKFSVANNILVKLTLMLSYFILEYLIYFGIIAFIVASIIAKSLIVGTFSILAGVIAFVFARIVRIARFEVDNTDEKSYLVNLLCSVTSVVAMIVAIIALLKGVA